MKSRLVRWVHFCVRPAEYWRRTLGWIDFRVILFGATGMLGQEVLRECLADSDVKTGSFIGRRETGKQDAKLTDMFALEELGSKLDGLDVCLYCLGMTSFRMFKKDYRRLTVDLTVSIGETLLRHNPGMRFHFLSGTGTDSTGTTSQMWARVKGEAENALPRRPFGAAMNDSGPRTGWMRLLYGVTDPFFPVMKALIPRHVSTTEELGRAMLSVAKHGFGRPILENWDFGKAVVQKT